MYSKITEDLNIIQKLSDMPNEEDDLTSSELKAKFDESGNKIKESFNRLIDELGEQDSAENIGASPIADGDESEDNVQAKLEKIYEDIQGISQGAVPDGSITMSKLNSSLVNQIGVRDGELQTGLNAEKLGGKTLSDILGTVAYGTYTGNGATQDINIGFKPRLLMVATNHKTSTSSNYQIDIVLGGVGETTDGGTISYELTDTGFKTRKNTRDYEFIYLAL